MKPKTATERKRGSASISGRPAKEKQTGRPVKIPTMDPALSQTKQDLVSRLYGKGVPYLPLPAVKRRFDVENPAQRPYSAKLQTIRKVSMSPFRRRLQELNATVYEEAKQQYRTEPAQGIQIEESKRYAAFEDLDASDIRPEEQIMRAQYQQMRKNRESLYSISKGSITGVSVMSSLKPKLNKSVDRSSIYSMKATTSHGARRKILRGNTGKLQTGMSFQIEKEQMPLTSQEYMQKACGQMLVDKMRSTDQNKFLPVVPQGRKVPEMLPSQIPVEITDISERFPEKKEEQDTLLWTNMDKFLQALLDNTETNHKFMYFNKKEGTTNPYDLEITTYNERKKDKHFTISNKGVTQYNGDKAMEFVPLREWLIERDLYSHIKEISFFQHFKRWKLLNAWRKKIWLVRKKKITESLEERLFVLDDIYRDHLLQHRAYMGEMSRLRVVDFHKQSDTMDMNEFLSKQAKKRRHVREKVSEYSSQCRDNFRTLMKRSLDKLRNRILLEKSLDDERAPQKPGITKASAANSVFEALGFPENMTYGHRAALRRECTRFLRLSYLVDFMTLQSLGDVYLKSVRETLDLLMYLDSNAQPEINAAQNILRKATTQEPILLVTLIFNPSIDIPKDSIKTTEIKAFRDHESKPKEFDLSAHVKIEPEKEDDASAVASILQKYYKKEVVNIVNYWIKLSPNKEDFLNHLILCFKEGLQSLECFMRWSRHDELTAYASALEEWDEIVGGSWEEPESEYLIPKDILSINPIYIKQEDDIKNVVNSAYSKCDDFLLRFNKYLNIYWRSVNVKFENLFHERVSKPVDALTNALKLLEYQKSMLVKKVPETCNYGILKIDCKITRAKLLPVPIESIRTIEMLAGNVLRERVKRVKQWMTVSKAQLEKKIVTVEDYVNQKVAWNDTADLYQEMKDIVDTCGEIYDILATFALTVKKDDKIFHTEVLQEIVQLNQQLSNISDQQELNLDKFKKLLMDHMIPNVQNELEELKKEIEDEVLLTRQKNITEIIERIESIESRFADCEKRGMTYREYQSKLNMEPIEFEIIPYIKQELGLRALMWRSLKQWDSLTGKWKAQQFSTINAKEIAQMVDQYAATAIQVDTQLPENPVSKELKSTVDTFKKAIPIVNALRNSELKGDHWESIKALLKSEFETTDSSFTLQTLLDMKALEFQEEIQQISQQASQESILTIQLKDLENMWKECYFSTKQFDLKDAYILDSTEGILNLLDESLVSINTILSNRFIKKLLKQAENWRITLNNLQAIMDEWTMLQREWLYFEHILTGPNARVEFAAETSKFDVVDKFFKGLMQSAMKARQPIKLVKQYKGDLLEHIRYHNKVIDEIKKLLEDELEVKRRGFPRFYFLSSNELLDLMGNQQNIEVIEKVLAKCFVNFKKLEINDNMEIVAIHSVEGERLHLTKHTRLKENLENWLDALQKDITESLSQLMKPAMVNYDASEPKDWVLLFTTYPSQIISVIIFIIWCHVTESTLLETSSNPNAMMEWYEENVEQIQQFMEIVKHTPNSLHRKIAVSYINNAMHGRDILESLILANISSPSNFEWLSKLRFYWEEEDMISQQKAYVSIQQLNAKLKYGFEYIGPMDRLIITPMTERCWISITSAAMGFSGVGLFGVPGTGKTETVKDLAAMIGLYHVEYNCSPTTSLKSLSRMISGASQQGSWLILEDFNRTNSEVLSIISKQITDIRSAFLCGATSITIEEREYAIKPTYMLFSIITETNSTANKFPESLKKHFRSTALVNPDIEQIAEYFLFSQGFSQSQILSKKLCKLYVLAHSLFGQCNHYDFSLRKIKAILEVMAKKRIIDPTAPEQINLRQAISICSTPRLLEKDKELFDKLVLDLLGSAPSYEESNKLEKIIEQNLILQGKKTSPTLIKKISELNNAIETHQGVILCGIAGSGKSSLYETLKSVLDSNNSSPIQQYIINPRSIQLSELFGEYNFHLQEYKDGLASQIFRKAARSEENSWIIFDGPVDSSWVESLNSLFDASHFVSVPNGERIAVGTKVTTLFETDKLADASPAVISRCGVVYVPAGLLSISDIVELWIQKKYGDNQVLNQELQSHLAFLFDQSMERGIQKIRASMVENIPTVDFQLISSVWNLFEAVYSSVSSLIEKTDKKKTVTQVFIFAYIWGLGGALDEGSREKLDFLIRSLFEGIDLPAAQSAFDFYLDTKKGMAFKPWAEILPSFESSEIIRDFAILVPTVETVRQKFIIENMLAVKKNMLYTGDIGVGKSLIMHNFLKEFQTSGIESIQINFSGCTNSLATQSALESNLQKKKRDVYGAPAGKSMVLFIDDINLPIPDSFGVQSPIEFLHQLLDKKGWYDREKYYWKNMEDTSIICVGGLPGNGRYSLSPRFVKQFNIISFPAPNKSTIERIYLSIYSEYLRIENYSEPIQAVAKELVNLSIDMFNSISEKIKPTPSKFYQMFSLRDLSRLFEGMMLGNTKTVDNLEKLGSLWLHELWRTFSDKCVSEVDKTWMEQLAVENGAKVFKTTWDYSEIQKNNLNLWGGIDPDNPTCYYEIESVDNIKEQLENLSQVYYCNSSKQSPLLFFKDAILHILKISRVLKQQKGYLMLIGTAGSGKATLTKFTAFLHQFEMKEMDPKSDFDYNNFRILLKNIFLSTGIQGKPTCFMMREMHIVCEKILEDLSNLINNGSVPSLFSPKELDQIIFDMRPIVSALKKDESRNSIYKIFLDRVRKNLKIVFCFANDTLRQRYRRFPLLFNNCNISYLSRWSDPVLFSISRNTFGFVETSSGIRRALSEMCVYIHNSVESQALEYLREYKQQINVTPSSFIEMVTIYKSCLTQSQRIEESKAKLSGALTQLLDAKTRINSMGNSLDELSPKLKEKADLIELIQKRIVEDQKLCTEKEKVVTAFGKEVSEKQNHLKTLAADADVELNKIKPEIDTAVNDIRNMDRKNIIEVRGLTSPNNSMVMIMEAVMFLLNEKPDWNNVRVVLTDANEFLTKLSNLTDNLLNVPDAVIKKLKTSYFTNSEFDPEMAGTKILAVKPLFKWVKSMVLLYEVLKKIEPKKKKYEHEKAKVDKASEELAMKIDEMNELKAKITRSMADIENLQTERNKIAEDIALMNRRQGGAGELVELLKEETDKWVKESKIIEESLQCIVGDSLMNSGYFAYLGQFNEKYRQKIIRQWLDESQRRNIPVSSNYSLYRNVKHQDPQNTFFAEWKRNGLPEGQYMAENALLAFHSQRWPLIIDPQNVAEKWLKNQFKKAGLQSIRQTQKDFIKNLSHSIRSGKPVLIMEVDDKIDPVLTPLIEKAFTQSESGALQLKLKSNEIEYDSRFQMFLFSKLHYPQYSTLVSNSLSLINFSMSTENIKQLFLLELIRQDKPEVENDIADFSKQIFETKTLMQKAENSILKLLSGSTLEQVLDDDTACENLKKAKKVLSDTSAKILEFKHNKSVAIEAKKEYLPFAERAASLCEIVLGLYIIDDSNYYSLEYLIKIFRKSITPVDGKLELKTLLNKITEMYYQSLSKGMSQETKNSFALLCWTMIEYSQKTIFKAEYDLIFNVKSLVSKIPELRKNPLPSLIPEHRWKFLCALDFHLPEAFDGVIQEINEKTDLWKNSILKLEFPISWKTKLNEFRQLLLSLAVFPQNVPKQIQNLVAKTFSHISPLSIETIFSETTRLCPLILFFENNSYSLLQEYYEFIKHKKSQDKLFAISMGQEQGVVAKKILQAAFVKGDWVILENCHLCKPWLKELELMMDGFKDGRTYVHEDFRLILTTNQAIQNEILIDGIKVVLENPISLKQSIKSIYLKNSYILDQFKKEMPKKDKKFSKLIYSMVLFHAYANDRTRFGSQGFNSTYTFPLSNLEASIQCARYLYEELEELPYSNLYSLIGDIFYSGDMTDSEDRLRVHAILKQFVGKEVTESIDFASDLQNEWLHYIDDEDYPISDHGLSENSLVQLNLSSPILYELLLNQIMSSPPPLNYDEKVLEIINTLLPKIPAVLELATAHKDIYPLKLDLPSPPLVLILLEEIKRYNSLLDTIGNTLSILSQSIQGEKCISSEYEIIYDQLLHEKVPDVWKIYSTCRSLGSWLNDLQDRVEYFRNWLMKGEPVAFWLPCFASPQSLLTTCLQLHCRNQKVGIERHSYSYTVLKGTSSDITKKPQSGIIIYGLYLSSGYYSESEEELQEDPLYKSVSPLPPVHLLPQIDYQQPKNVYACPVYFTSKRASDPILHINLQTKKSSDYWVKRGTTLLLEVEQLPIKLT